MPKKSVVVTPSIQAVERPATLSELVAVAFFVRFFPTPSIDGMGLVEADRTIDEHVAATKAFIDAFLPEAASEWAVTWKRTLGPPTQDPDEDDEDDDAVH